MTRSFLAAWRPSTAPILSVLLTLSSPALAQDAPASDQPAETEETTPEPDKPAEEQKPEETEPAAEKAPPAEPAKRPDDERERTVALVGVEHLSGSAYPEPTTRGIHGGSLWLTMHGLQWPYMPMYAGEPAARIGFSGSVWADMSYARTDSGRPETEYNDIRWEQQSRFVLRTTPTYSTAKGWFVQGQGEIVLNGAAPALASESFSTDDLYVRAGKWELFDVTVGRFQGWELYHMGMALDLNTYERVGPLVGNGAPSPAQIYGLTHYWDRPNGPGNVALHLYGPPPVNFLRAEVLGQMGNASGLVRLAVRPMLIVDWGMNLPGTQGYRLAVKAKVGFEHGDDRTTSWTEDYQHRIPTLRNQTVRKGWGTSLAVVFDPYVEIGGAYAEGIQDRWDERGQLIEADSHTTTSMGGFLNVQPIKGLVVGVGVHKTDRTALNCTVVIPPVPPATTPSYEDCSLYPNLDGDPDTWALLQYFGAIQYEPLPNFFAKLVLAHGKADYDTPSADAPPYTHETGSLFGLGLAATARLRLMYLF